MTFSATSLNSDALSFVLVETTHSGNIGAAARAMKTMGFSKLRLVRPCKYLTAEALARASGADDIVRNAAVYDSLDEAVSDCIAVYGTSARSRSMEWSVTDVPEMARALMKEPVASAIVFGRERSGLTNEELARCNGRLWIPSNPDFSSLNLASAVQVVAYELRRASGFSYTPEDLQEQGRSHSSPVDNERTTRPDHPETPVAGEVEEPMADHAALQNFFQHLEDVMVRTGFLDPDNPRLLMQRMRRLFGRNKMLRSEVQVLRGFLTSVEKSSIDKDRGQSL